jgi:hypothetical protein
MRTLFHSLASSTALLTLAFAPASASGPVATAGADAPAAQSASEIVLVREGPGSVRTGVIRYEVFQRVSPLLAAGGRGGVASQVVVTPNDAVQVCYDLSQSGWEQICTLAVDEHPSQAKSVGTASVATSAAMRDAQAAVPAVLAVAPAGANPMSGGALVVDVALPGAGAARLDLMDVMGRRVASRELGELGVGRHAVNLSDGQRFAPGVYMLRVTQGADARVARVTVVD